MLVYPLFIGTWELVLIILIIVLIFKPTGLFGEAANDKV